MGKYDKKFKIFNDLMTLFHKNKIKDSNAIGFNAYGLVQNVTFAYPPKTHACKVYFKLIFQYGHHICIEHHHIF